MENTSQDQDILSLRPFEAEFWTLRRLAGAAGIALLLGALFRFSDLTAYLILSIALSFIGRPLVQWCDRTRIAGRAIGSTVGAVLALLLMFMAFGLLVSLFAPLVTAEANVLSSLDFQGAARDLRQLAQDLLPMLLDGGEDPLAWLDTGTLGDALSTALGPDGLGGFLGGLFSLAGNLVVALFSISFMTFFFLKDRQLFPSILRALTPDRHMKRVERILENSTHLLTRYFIGLAAQVAIITTIVTGGLWLLGVPNAFLIGFLAGLLNLIPYVGPLLGAGLGLAIILTTHLQAPELGGLMGKAGLVFLAGQLVDNFFTQPVIFAGSVKAHPLEIFLLISIAGSLAGITGMMLAIPAYSLIRVVAKEFLSGFKVIQALTDEL